MKIQVLQKNIHFLIFQYSRTKLNNVVNLTLIKRIYEKNYNYCFKFNWRINMKILAPHDEFGWITAVIEGHWVQAKVYDEPSTYGVNNGRVSKLAVGKESFRNPNQNFFDQMCYNYDRGLDFDNAPSGLINKIVAELETLPKLFPEEAKTNEEAFILGKKIKK